MPGYGFRLRSSSYGGQVASRPPDSYYCGFGRRVRRGLGFSARALDIREPDMQRAQMLRVRISGGRGWNKPRQRMFSEEELEKENPACPIRDQSGAFI